MLLSELIPAAAERFPDRTACLDSSNTVDYRQLEAMTTRMAAWLQDVGLERGDTVGILLEKTVRTAIAFHGVLRAGGIVVPLDIAAPTLPLRRVADDCDLRFLISEPSMSEKVNELSSEIPFQSVFGQTHEDGTSSWDTLTAYPGSLDAPQLEPSDPAYLVYTSGSTGLPKGIEHSHRSGYEFARRAVETYGVGPHDVISGFPPLHFDQSTFEMLAAPLAGASVVLVHDRDRMFAARLTQLIEHHRISIWYSVPTALVQMLDYGVVDDRDLTSLRWVKFGGEVFPMQKLRALMNKMPAARFSNVYGPAEVNQCTFYHLDQPPPDGADAVPLGRMWSDSVARVRTEDDQMSATGTGELCVATPTMMTGYWGRPRETEASTPQIDLDGTPTRFYRTGDEARIDKDGTIWFKGRIDHQVKVRGARVELEAVDAALESSGLVVEAAAFIDRRSSNRSRLLAAVVPLGKPADDVDGILKHLRAVLPSQAVPENIYVVDSIPRNTNGKVDRALLATNDYNS